MYIYLGACEGVDSGSVIKTTGTMEIKVDKIKQYKSGGNVTNIACTF